MSVVKRAVLLTLLLAAIGSSAAAGPEDCHGLNVTLQTKDIHKIFGDWVLVWSVTDHDKGNALLPKVTSSHVEFRLRDDKKTVMFTERNAYTHQSCVTYIINMTMPTDPQDSTMTTFPGSMEKDGLLELYNETATVTFFETCPDCLSMVFKDSEGRFLLNYRKDGHHLNVHKLKDDHSDHHKLATCLGFPADAKPFNYDGAADFCHKKSTDCQGLDVKMQTKDIHKIFGDWVLVWSVTDHDKGNALLPKVTSSHVEFRLRDDKKTVMFTERNAYTHQSCVTYIINMTMPTDPQDSTMTTFPGSMEKDGLLELYNETASVTFFETCPDCLSMVFKDSEGQFLLNYRKDGHHLNVHKLKADHSDHHKLAACLGFPTDAKPFNYDGAADFCHKKSTDCQGLDVKLQTKDIPRIFGEWVLVWSVTDHEKGNALLPKVTSSHVEFTLRDDKKTVMFTERNAYTHQACVTYIINMTMPTDPQDSTMTTFPGSMEKDGLLEVYNETATVNFFETCPDCLSMVFKDSEGRFLLNYRKDGYHRNVHKLKADHSDHHKLAACLGFPTDAKPFNYDGDADFCHKKSTDCQGLDVKMQTKDIHKIFGEWVLVWSVTDHEKGKALLPKVTSSHVEFTLRDDKKTVMFTERNAYTG
ncbi:saxitoxin and tetrodotoxin-binding protein 1 isoform X2 [Perca flavescens]|uniref:saxitoxin and tetrodotoxin-binding protein 1 isoform X2 n=1 Tax=Perca flavescens TaxID=8167 RepID=UPI00106EAC61|nr:saxitoxin and tetrodotoxin-binding protein 1-like isoform X2 [Perca flavescens]